MSSINWVVPNLDLANGGTTMIASDSGSGPGSIVIYCAGAAGARTHFIIDLTGYFVP